MTGASDDARYVRADCDDDDSTGAPLADDNVFFDHVQAENSIVGFYLLVKIAALQSMIDDRLTRADTAAFAIVRSHSNLFPFVLNPGSLAPE